MSKKTKTLSPVQQKLTDEINKSNAKRAKRDFKAHISAGSGGATLDMVLTFGADGVPNIVKLLPKQVKLSAQYLVEVGGDNETAMVADLNKYAETADGDLFWGKGKHHPYDQAVSKILSKYMPKLLGKVEWSPKIGKQEIFRIV